MHRTIATVSIAATLIGVAPAVFAQSESSSPAQMLGVQERSIKTQPTQQQATPLNREQLSSNSPDGQLVLYRIDPKTRVVIGPANNRPQPGELPGADATGDNKVQLLHDLDQ
ncbi:MAG: hypothetical protein HC866_07380 [Leptolyngbyaceae cyanobacterium RU_5_1]|nr:hypothetical protein [Leptolyngbyaceae cyanobacterium RU_5_1]